MKAYELQNALMRVIANLGKRSDALAAAVMAVPRDDPDYAAANRRCAENLRGLLTAIDVVVDTEIELLEELKCKSEATDAAQSAGGN